MSSFGKILKQHIQSTKRVDLKRAFNDVLRSSKEFTGPVLLAKSYFKNNGEPSIPDIKGWWQSEKFDGYRAVWTGSKFVSRTGKEFVSPKWFKELMPPQIPLDGELWMGRSQFEQCGGIRRKEPQDKDWAHVQYLIFDMPTVLKPFEIRKDLIDLVASSVVANAQLLVRDRHPHLRQFLPKHWEPAQAVKQIRATSLAQVRKDLDRIVKQGGEGLMLRKPKSLYEGKRSSTLLKVKKAFDAECRVIGYKPGAGKYAGKLGAFHCALVKNPKVKFYLSGMTDKVRGNYKTTHPVGTVLTFMYNETNKSGVPRFPRYLRIRTAE
jgi:DNA ligase 1